MFCQFVFVLLWINIFYVTWAGRVSEVKYFRKFQLILTNKVSNESLSRQLHIVFISRNFNEICIFLCQFFFLPTYMFDFNKWDLKWKDMIPSTYFRKKKSLKMETEKSWKVLGGGNICPIFYKFQDLLFFYEGKTTKSI